MERKEILEGNKIISVFLGGTIADDGFGEYVYGESFGMPDTTKRMTFHAGVKYLEVSMLNYHESWDTLMPVIEKIEQSGVPFVISGNDVHVGTPSNDSYYWQGGFTYDSKIISAWHGVVQFIKWDNNQNEKQI